MYDLGNELREEVFIENLVVKLRILDLNDNAPKFDMSFDFAPSMDEDDLSTIATERFIAKIKATDLDRTLFNSATECEIVDVVNGQIGWFTLKPNSLDNTVHLLKLPNVNLDREKHSTITVRVRAFNTNDRTRYAERDILIGLLDLNDNEPVITSDSNTDIKLAEDFPLYKTFFGVKAYDLDEIGNRNSILIYEITNRLANVFFRIDPANGDISLVKPLDFDRADKRIQIDVKVKDSTDRPHIVTRTFFLSVQNVNDNAPTFASLPRPADSTSEHKCVLRLDENLNTFSLIYRFAAQDLDQSVDKTFTFMLNSVSTFDVKSNEYLVIKQNDAIPFTLGVNTGELVLARAIDRETIDNYLLNIAVFDLPISNVQNNVSVDCVVQVLDVNDNR